MEKKYQIIYETKSGKINSMKTSQVDNTKLIERIFGYKVIMVKEIIIIKSR